ncbi:MAG: hypothetical protein J1F41_07655, partial [Lachnospiraceae bacterium]|nr:hypothetical protein [Lachnospiraceae bacterium]
TYTGMGHARKDDWREPYTFEEAKLFINTMIAAYQAGMKAPNIDILESGRADAPKIKTLYRHFDEINMIPLSDAVTETYEKVYFKVTDLNFVKGTRTIETHVFYETSAGTETITVGTDDIVVNRLEDRFYDPVTETPVAADALDSGGVYYIEVPKSILDDCENGLDLYFEAQSTIIPYTNNQASLTPEEIEKRTRRTDKVYAKLKVLRSYLFELD